MCLALIKLYDVCFPRWDGVMIVDAYRFLAEIHEKYVRDFGINIVKLNTVVDGPEARIFVTVNVSGKEQLDRTCDRILRVKDVVDVIRN